MALQRARLARSTALTAPLAIIMGRIRTRFARLIAALRGPTSNANDLYLGPDSRPYERFSAWG